MRKIVQTTEPIILSEEKILGGETISIIQGVGKGWEDTEIIGIGQIIQIIGILGNRNYKNNRENTNKRKWKTIFIEYENNFKFNAKFVDSRRRRLINDNKKRKKGTFRYQKKK